LTQTAIKINVDSQKYAIGDTYGLVPDRHEQTYYEAEKYRFESLLFSNCSRAEK
jgi:hypothetical protein